MKLCREKAKRVKKKQMKNRNGTRESLLWHRCIFELLNDGWKNNSWLSYDYGNIIINYMNVQILR